MKLNDGIVLGIALGVMSAAAWPGCSSATNAGGAGADAGAGGDGAAGGAAGDGSAAGDGATPAVSCAAYCAAAIANCGSGVGLGQGTDVAYKSVQGCLNQCALMDIGTYNDSHDSVGCRQYHASAAAADPHLHCPHAGAYGGGVCGQRCEAFCKQATALCDGKNSVPRPYADSNDCATRCASWPLDDGGFELRPDKNVINCREYHLTEAYSDPDAGAPADHCNDLVDLADGGGTCQQ